MGVKSKDVVTVPRFRQLKSDSGEAVFLLECRQNYSTSMKLLRKAGIRPLGLRKALPLLENDRALNHELRGMSFWLKGKRIRRGGVFGISKKGDLIRPTVYRSMRSRHGRANTSCSSMFIRAGTPLHLVDLAYARISLQQKPPGRLLGYPERGYLGIASPNPNALAADIRLYVKYLRW